VNGNQPSIKLERFRKLLLNSVDEGLDVLGASAKHAIYYTLKKKYGVSREDIALKPEKFSLALRSIFGSLGAQFLVSIRSLPKKNLNDSAPFQNVSFEGCACPTMK